MGFFFCGQHLLLFLSELFSLIFISIVIVYYLSIKITTRYFKICNLSNILSGSAKYQAEKEKEVYSNKKVPTKETNDDSKSKLLKVWSSVKVLLTNPTFMFLNLAAAAEGIL